MVVGCSWCHCLNFLLSLVVVREFGNHISTHVIGKGDDEKWAICWCLAHDLGIFVGNVAIFKNVLKSIKLCDGVVLQ